MEYRKKRELVRKYQWSPVSGYGRSVWKQSLSLDSSEISGVQEEGMLCTSGVRWGVGADQVGKNSIDSQDHLYSSDVLKKDDLVSLLPRGRYEKRTLSDCDVRASQEEANRKRFADGNVGDLRFDFIAIAKSFMVEENLCAASTKEEASEDGGTIKELASAKEKASEDGGTIKELASAKVLVGAEAIDRLKLDGSIGTGRAEFSTIGSESISKGLFSAEVFSSSIQELSEHRLNPEIIDFIKNILFLMVEIDNIKVNIGVSSKTTVVLFEKVSDLMPVIKKILNKLKELHETETKSITEITIDDHSSVIAVLLKKFDEGMCSIRKILKEVEKEVEKGIEKGIEKENELGSRETKNIINTVDTTRIVYLERATLCQADLWSWNLDICRVRESENEFEVSFNSTKECYQKHPDTEKALTQLTVLRDGKYVFVLTSKEGAGVIKVEDDATVTRF